MIFACQQPPVGMQVCAFGLRLLVAGGRCPPAWRGWRSQSASVGCKAGGVARQRGLTGWSSCHLAGSWHGGSIRQLPLTASVAALGGWQQEPCLLHLRLTSRGRLARLLVRCSRPANQPLMPWVMCRQLFSVHLRPFSAAAEQPLVGV